MADKRRTKDRNPSGPVSSKSTPLPEGKPIAQIARLEAYAGPIPPPSMLIKYNDAVPNAAERILAMAERQSAHREEMESAVVAANIRSQTRGSYFGFIIAMTAILGGIYLIKIGNGAPGLAAIICSLVALASVFIIGKKREGQERRQKAEALDHQRRLIKDA